MSRMEAAYSSNNPYAATSDLKSYPSTGNPYVSAYSTNMGSVVPDEKAPVQYPKLVRKYPSDDSHTTSYDSHSTSYPLRKRGYPGLPLEKTPENSKLEEKPWNNRPNPREVFHPSYDSILTSYNSHSTSYPLRTRGYPGLPLGQTPEKSKLEEKPWNNRSNPKEVLSEVPSKLKESSRYYGSTRSRKISPESLPSETRAEKDHGDKWRRRRSRGHSKQRSRSRSRSRSHKLRKKRSNWRSRSRSRSPKPHKMKNSSPRSDSRNKLLDPNRIPTPPPPPILSPYDLIPGRPMESMKKPADKPKVYSDKEKGSLSCLLEAVMENTGQRKSQVSDPKMKREILSKCESKIRQLYKRRTSGIGAFIPDSFVPRLINSCGSPLITFHPHITFNNEPEASVWNCPGIEVPSIKKIDPTLSISTTIFSMTPLKRQESSSQKTFHGKDTISSDTKTNDPEEFPRPYVRTGSGWPVYKRDIKGPTPTNQLLSDLPKSKLKRKKKSKKKTRSKPLPVGPPSPVPQQPMVHQIPPSNYLPPNHTSNPPGPFNPNYSYPSNYPSPMPSTHFTPGYGYYNNYNFPIQNPNFNQQQIHSQNYQATSEAIDPVKEAQERFIRKLQRGEPIRSESKDNSSSHRNLHDDRCSTSSRKRSHDRHDRSSHDKMASDVRMFPTKISRDRKSNVTPISIDSFNRDSEGSMKSRKNKSKVIGINSVDDEKSAHSNDTKASPLTVEEENQTRITYEDLLNLGSQLRSFQNQSILHKGFIDATCIKNNVFCKGLVEDSSADKVIVPREFLRPFIKLCHEKFHSINRYELNQAIKLYVYPQNSMSLSYVNQVFDNCKNCKTSNTDSIDKNQQSEVPIKHLKVDNSSCEKQEDISAPGDNKTEPLIKHAKLDDSSDDSKKQNLTPSVEPTKQLKADNSSVQKHKETAKPKVIKAKPPIKLITNNSLDDKHIHSTNCTDIATVPPITNIKVDNSLDENNKETKIQTVSKIKSPIKHLKVNDSPDEKEEAPTVNKIDSPITHKKMGDPSNKKLDQTVSCVIIKSESSYDKSVKSSLEIKSDEQAINSTKGTNDKAIQGSEEKTLFVLDKSSKHESTQKDINNSLTIHSTITLIDNTENSKEKAIEESKTNVNEINITKNESSNFSNSNVTSSDRMDSKSNSIPKQNMPSLDFKGRIREVQLKSKEFGEKLIGMESGNISDKNEDSFILKGGMLCKKVLTNNKPEVKIVAPSSEVERLIEIVHSMSVTHSPPDKVVAFFSKHFTPVEELEIKVNKYIKKCSLCN